MLQYDFNLCGPKLRKEFDVKVGRYHDIDFGEQSNAEKETIEIRVLIMINRDVTGGTVVL